MTEKESRKGRMRGTYEKPQGLFYYPGFISKDEETRLLNFITDLSYQEVRIHNQPAKRTVKQYGFTYDYQGVKVIPGEPFPKIIRELSDKCAELAGLAAERIVQCIITYYPPEAGIGWHVDKLLFGSEIIGVSLSSSCVMRFQKKENDIRHVYEQELNSCSAYVLSGESRYKWEHSIPSVNETRYSITFRTMQYSV